MVPACHRKMGKIAGQASYAETARPPCLHHSGFYQTGGLGSRPIRRQQYHRHRCQSAGPPLPGHRPGKAVSGTEQGKKRGAGIADDSPRLPAPHQGYRGDGENGAAGRLELFQKKFNQSTAYNFINSALVSSSGNPEMSNKRLPN